MANSPTPADFSNPIDVADAQVMVQLYLDRYQGMPNQVKSLLVKADSLRSYLKDPSIEYVKMMFAYEDQAHADLDEQTIVIVGVSETVDPKTGKTVRDFVYLPGNQVLDECLPCPNNCGYADDNFPILGK